LEFSLNRFGCFLRNYSHHAQQRRSANNSIYLGNAVLSRPLSNDKSNQKRNKKGGKIMIVLFQLAMLCFSTAVFALIFFGNVPGTHTPSPLLIFIMGGIFVLQIINVKKYLLEWKAEK
jgi:hypothetical protein